MKTLSDVRACCTITGGHWLWKGGVRSRKHNAPVIYAWDFSQGRYRPQVGMRATWQMRHQREVPEGLKVYRTCTHSNCVNPSCAACGTPADINRHFADSWKTSTRAQVARLAANRRRAVMTPERIREAQESTETGRALAERWGVHFSKISKARRGLYRIYDTANPFAGLVA